MSKTFIAQKDTLDAALAGVAVSKADLVYGFIEHNAVLDPSQRIEYIGANIDYSPISITMGGGYDLGDWADFPWLMQNRPYMVRSDGTPDYPLDPDDYTQKFGNPEYWEGAGATEAPSDVDNEDYDGGAFAWLPKIYKREYMAGNDRYVYFSLKPRPGFEAWGFVDNDGNELEGLWLPMFYASTDGTKAQSLAGTAPTVSKTCTQEIDLLSAVGTRAVHFGGPIAQTIIDLQIMFAKTTYLQGVYGTGNTSSILNNAVVDGGQFFATNDNTHLNKIFHSVLLGTYQLYVRDPYLIAFDDSVKIATDYIVDQTGASYLDTGIELPASTQYPSYFRTVGGFGALPVYPYNGTITTGGCCSVSNMYPNEITCANRFKTSRSSPRSFNTAKLSESSNRTFGVMLLPPAGISV